ncbi:unnamed protein product [Heligmosomoides polygyrus]|uniref:Glycerol-3-phosphate dehydrogenase n=1 Tax=Heligmosomoides polygyrus TaxID=6339 RepID=A0A183GU55_HELPZ|nr:unnamed protein product [Heligmosomoides polygyrus]
MEKAWRVARITRPTVMDRIDEFFTDPENLDYAFIIKQYLKGGLGLKVATTPSWLQSIFKVTLNNPELYALEQPAVLGIGTARDMAKLAQLLLDGKLVSEAAGGSRPPGLDGVDLTPVAGRRYQYQGVAVEDANCVHPDTIGKCRRGLS